MKSKKYSLALTTQDMLDLVLIWEQRGLLTKFALNYRAYINGKWYEVYRVDNYHGFLHEQKFWRSPEPIPIKHKEGLDLRFILDEYQDEIIDNYKKYRSYFEKTQENE